jgi:hypothetical protein
MGEYVGTFGVTRISGRDLGRDVKYDVTSKPALGMTKFLEVTVDENGPVANVGEGFGKDAVALPAGAVVTDAYLLTAVKGSASGVSISLVKKDGSDSKALLGAATPAGDNAVNQAEGEVLGTRLAEDRYFTSAGTKTGLKAKLVVEYV